MRRILFALVVSSSVAVTACSSAPDAGPSVASQTDDLTGCHGTASSTKPASGVFYLTSFGNSASDDGVMSCGEYTKDGSWYYAASRQRFGCGSHVQVEANGKCVVVETDDYGPDVCVENAAGKPILDASPLVAEHLFGASGAGWSDRLAVTVTEVPTSTPLGPCAGSGGGTGTDAGGSGSGTVCYSSTLGKNEPAGTCVQSRADRIWYQCDADGWESGVSNGAGPLGTCTTMHAL
jgi:hypothetical protein